MARPYFTVNIAVYNQLDNLKVILQALDAQLFRDFEIIVCDDGSSDGTREWMEQNRGDIKYFWQEDEGFRLAKSKNNGIRAATGEYFVSLEGDVIPNYKMLSEYKLWSKPDTVLLGVRHDILELPELPLDFSKLDDSIEMFDFRSQVLRMWDKVVTPWRFCSGCNFLIPTDTLKEIGGWNENFKHYGIDDYEVCLRLYMAGLNIKPCMGAYGYHLKHDIRQTTEDNIRMLEELEAAYESSN
jgi:GT2 family glycosyltransferase